MDEKMGAGTVARHSQGRIGRRQGWQATAVRRRAVAAGAILLIMMDILFRFDFRYAPGTVVALLHDAVGHGRLRGDLQGILADHGGGHLDHHRVLDERHHRGVRPHPRKRGPLRDRKFDRIVNQSINETLSRTILTSATVFS